MTKQTVAAKPTKSPKGEAGQNLSEAQLSQVAGGSWGMLPNNSARPTEGTSAPVPLLPAVQ